MDDRRFDQLSRALASGRSRRHVLKGLLGIGAATLTGEFALDSADAARRSSPTPTPTSCPGTQIWTGSACACPTGQSVCGPACCDTPEACCDGACCDAGTVCIGEETCCPAEAMCGGVCCLNGTCLGGSCCDAAFVCGETCCNTPGLHCCNGSCQQCCSDSDCATTEYCSNTGLCTPGCNEDSDCAHLTTACTVGACQNNACVAVDTCTTGSCCGSVCLDCASEATFCLSSTCDPTTSTCIHQNINDEQTCAEPDNLCVDYRCRFGTCTNVSLLLCPPRTDDGCAATACNPATGQCEPAEPFTADGTACQGGACAGGVCCTGCAIDGVCYQEGDFQPGNLCNSCQTASSQSDWTPVSCPIQLEFCRSNICNPDNGTCSMQPSNEGQACGPQSTSQCFTGLCTAGECASQPVADGTACSTDLSPNFCASGGEGTCQAGQCIAGAAHEGEQCGMDNSSYPACGNVVCRAGVCTREPMNSGLSCTLSNYQPVVCHEKTGTCSDGYCQTAQFAAGTVCGEYSSCIDAVCAADGTCTGTANKANGATCIADPADCVSGTCSDGTCLGSSHGSGDQCPYEVPAACEGVTGTCNGDGTCSFSGRGPSFGKISCGDYTSGGPDESKCCPGQVCICPPLDPNFCIVYGCWYPGDIPTTGV